MRASAAAGAPAHKGKDAESDAVHAWRVSQLTRLGLASPVAGAVAGKVDWHAVAKLVESGCPAALAVTIVQ
jgi:hypothetical protein